MRTMKIEKRERPGGWRTECKRGQWYAVDRRTGRRVRAHGADHAAAIASDNNIRELCFPATTPAACVWGSGR